jgi:pimeloyl-ACP methyl ester carboxylesterase
MLLSLGRRSLFIVPFLLAAPSFAANLQGVRVVCPSYAIEGTEDAKWRVPIKVLNDLDVGVFGDSLACEVEDLDPGLTGSGRRFHGTSNAITSVMKSLGQRDSATINFTGLASCERAHLTFHLFTHTADGVAYESRGTCTTAPSLIARSFPSTFIEDKGRRIETVLVPERWPQGSSPGILIVHPEGSHARRLLPMAWSLCNAGYTVMMVSLPGYGQTTGPADFGGPASVHAVSRALDALLRATQVDSTRIAVWGISRGATVAALLAAERPKLAALVLQSGLFEPATAYRATQSDSLRRALDREGKSEGGWSRRSALRVARRIRMPVLFIHGDHDLEVVSNQSIDLAAKLRAAGGDVQLELVPGGEHALPSSVTYPMVMAFLKPRLRPIR